MAEQDVAGAIRWDLFGALLPFILGTFALWLFGEDVPSAVTTWLADGFLMAPAAMLLLGAFRRLAVTQGPVHPAATWGELILALALLLTGLILAVSVSDLANGHSAKFAWTNGVWFTASFAAATLVPRHSGRNTGDE